MHRCLALVLASLVVTQALVAPKSLTPSTRLASTAGNKDVVPTNTEESNPCWEDFYDDDCAMTNTYSANFVAAQWIKSMPCAEGVEDCDMPADLSMPETRPEAGVDHVDVMGMLGLKRAESINASKNTKRP